MTSLAFDIYGTLIDPFSIKEKLLETVGDKADEFNILWRDKQLEYSFRKAAMKQFNHFSECTQMALEYCDLYLGTGLSEDEKNGLLGAYRILPVYEDTKSTLESLRNRGIEIIAFSNGKKEDLKSLFENSGIHHLFDQIISVDEVRTFKPSPLVYELLASNSKYGRENTWLISANAFDVIGAAAIGLPTIWLKRNKKAIYDPFKEKPTRTIDSLSSLVEMDFKN